MHGALGHCKRLLKGAYAWKIFLLAYHRMVPSCVSVTLIILSKLRRSLSANVAELFANLSELFANLGELFANLAELFANLGELLADLADLCELYAGPKMNISFL